MGIEQINTRNCKKQSFLQFLVLSAEFICSGRYFSGSVCSADSVCFCYFYCSDSVDSADCSVCYP